MGKMASNKLSGILWFAVGCLLAAYCVYTLERLHGRITKMQANISLTEQKLGQLKFISLHQKYIQLRRRRDLVNSNLNLKDIGQKLQLQDMKITDLQNEIVDVRRNFAQAGKQLQDMKMSEKTPMLRLLDEKITLYSQSDQEQELFNARIKEKITYLDKKLDQFTSAIIMQVKAQTNTLAELKKKLIITDDILLQQSSLLNRLNKLEKFKMAVLDAVDLGKALYTAVIRNDIETIRILGEMKVDTEYADEEGNRPLHQAVRYFKVHIVEELLHIGAQVSSIGQNLFTPLHWAITIGCIECAKILLNNGADVNFRDENQNTPLLLAAAEGNLQLISLLIYQGARVNTANELGYTSIQFALMNGHCDCLQILIDNGADVNAPSRDDTLLHMAVTGDNVDCVKILIENGANPNVKNSEGRTPLADAIYLEHETIIAVMNKNGTSV